MNEVPTRDMGEKKVQRETLVGMTSVRVEKVFSFTNDTSQNLEGHFLSPFDRTVVTSNFQLRFAMVD